MLGKFFVGFSLSFIDGNKGGRNSNKAHHKFKDVFLMFFFGIGLR